MPNVDFAKKAVVKVQERSAFDKSFRNLLTTKCGTLTPILCDEVIPNTTVNLKLAMSCTLPPLASETFMNVNLKTEAFFVPSRLLMLGFEDFIQGNDEILTGSTTNGATKAKIRVPRIKLDPASNGANFVTWVKPGTLADYLGFRVDWASIQNDPTYLCALPFYAYHLIYDTWYRNPLVTKSCFDDSNYYITNTGYGITSIKTKKPIDNAAVGFTVALNSQFRDGVRLGDLRQRNFGSDYFTTATPTPQNGPAQKIQMALPYGDDTNVVINGTSFTASDASIDSDNILEAGDASITDASFVNSQVVGGAPVNLSFTISALRACNSLQMWLERNQLSNNKFVDFLKAQYNANLKDSIAQRPVYLGSASFPVYSKGIYQTAADSNSGNNPFDSVGSRYGHAYAEGTDFIIDHYTAEEPGYIMVLASLVPEVTYSSGVNKYLMRYLQESSYGEMANPILQNVGPEPIMTNELDYIYNPDSLNYVFGYVDRFASWMTRNNELHGLLRDGESLESFALQRGISGIGQVGVTTNFLQIPTNFMDQVTAVDQAISQYGCWIDSWLDYKVVQPLGKYVIPSLQDPAYEHGQTVVVNKRGRIME